MSLEGKVAENYLEDRYKACSIKSHAVISWCLGCIINYVNIAIQANEQESLYFSQRQYLSS